MTMPTNLHDPALNVAFELDRLYDRYQEISGQIAELGETQEHLTELTEVEFAMIGLLEEQEETILALNDAKERADAEAARLKEKAGRIQAQSAASQRRADWYKSFMTKYLVQFAPKGIHTDEGKFHIRSSQSVKVHSSIETLLAELKDRLQLDIEKIAAKLAEGSDSLDAAQALILDDLLSFEITVNPNKQAIKKALKEADIDGFSLEETQTIALSKPRKSKKD
jgi:hypothetical protein